MTEENASAVVPRIEQLRRAHASARPKATENPAWFHTHNDVTYLLGLHDALLAALIRIAERPAGHHDCDDYTRGYGQCKADMATIAEAALKSVKSTPAALIGANKK